MVSRITFRSLVLTSLCLSLLVLTTACQDDPKKTPAPKKKKSSKEKDDGKKDKPKPVEKKERDPDDPFDPDDSQVLFDIFRGMRLKGSARQDVLLKYLLVDDRGDIHRGRMEVYQDAITKFAKDHPKKWGDFVYSLELKESDR